MKHKVAVTVSEPDHPSVAQRKETKEKFVRVTADSKESAVAKAKAHYKKQGYKVHGCEYHSEIKEEAELDEAHQHHVVSKLEGNVLASYKTKEEAHKNAHGNPVVSGDLETIGDKHYVKEAEQIDEISKEKAEKYLRRANGDFTHQDMGSRNAYPEQRPEFERKKKLRQKGISQAIDRLTKEEDELDEALPQIHKIAVTVSSPKHPIISARQDKKEKLIKVGAKNKEDAIEKAKEHFRKGGFKVHSAEHHSTILEGKIDKDHPIVKEYNALKKEDIKTLRNMIKQQSRIVDTSGFTSKDHAISHYLRNKHGDKRVDQAFGFKEETNLDESDSIPSVYQKRDAAGTYHIEYSGKDKDGTTQKKLYKVKANDHHHAQFKVAKIAGSDFPHHIQGSSVTHKFIKEEQMKSFSDFIEEASCSKTDIIKKAVKKMKEQTESEDDMDQLDEATIAYHVKKAEEAKARGDDKKFAYHMDNARTARYAMTGKEMIRNRHHLDKYTELRNAK